MSTAGVAIRHSDELPDGPIFHQMSSFSLSNSRDRIATRLLFHHASSPLQGAIVTRESASPLHTLRLVQLRHNRTAFQLPAMYLLMSRQPCRDLFLSDYN